MGHQRSNHLDTTTSTGSASKFDVSGFHTTRPSLPARHHVLLIPEFLPLEKIELGSLIFELRFFYITVSTRSRLSVAQVTNKFRGNNHEYLLVNLIAFFVWPERPSLR